MYKLSLTLPGFSSTPIPIANPDSLKTNFTDLASILSGLLNIALYIAVFLSFYWFVWGAYQYIFSHGEKENLAKARERIKWALIGLLITFMAYFIAKFASEIFPTQGGIPF